MLSGIGPEEQLGEHGIAVREALPGRAQPPGPLRGVRPLPPRRAAGSRWRAPTSRPTTRSAGCGRRSGAGMYISNGAALAMKRNSPGARRRRRPLHHGAARRLPGLLSGLFERALREQKDVLSWAILKARTANTAGTVTLRSADPRDPPRIEFNYFDRRLRSGRQGPQGGRRRGRHGARDRRRRCSTAHLVDRGNLSRRPTSRARRSSSGSATMPGATTPPAPARWARATRAACSTAGFGSTESRGCGWSTRRSSRASPAISSSAPSTWPPRRPPT